MGYFNFGVIIFAGILLFLMIISVVFRAGVIISTCISLIFCFYFGGISVSFGHLRWYFAYFLFLFGGNFSVFWSSSPVFWDYFNEASRRNHRFYEISSFFQIGLAVFV